MGRPGQPDAMLTAAFISLSDPVTMLYFLQGAQQVRNTGRKAKGFQCNSGENARESDRAGKGEDELAAVSHNHAHAIPCKTGKLQEL